MLKCLIDGTEHYGVKELHAHLRKLKVTQKDYYEKYVTKKDLLTGELIEFKDYKSYEISDFKNKINHFNFTVVIIKRFFIYIFI